MYLLCGTDWAFIYNSTFCCQPCLLQNRRRGSFCGERVKRPRHAADHSPPCNAEDTNEWSYTSTPYALMVYTLCLYFLQAPGYHWLQLQIILQFPFVIASQISVNWGFQEPTSWHGSSGAEFCSVGTCMESRPHAGYPYRNLTWFTSAPLWKLLDRTLTGSRQPPFRSLAIPAYKTEDLKHYEINGKLWWGKRYSEPSRLTLWPIQAPVRWLPDLFPRGKSSRGMSWPATAI